MRHNKCKALGIMAQEGKRMPARPPDDFYSQRKGETPRAGGTENQKKKKEKQECAWQTCIFMWREKRGGKINLK